MSNESSRQVVSPSEQPLRVVSVVAMNGTDDDQLMAAAAGLAHGLEPTIAEAILESARERGITPGRPHRFDETTSIGVIGIVNGRTVAIGTAALFAQLGLSTACLCDWPERMRAHGQRVLFVAIDGRAAGFLGVTPIDPAELNHWRMQCECSEE